MRTIYKFPICLEAEQAIWMPRNADILCLQLQHALPYIWAAVEDNAACENRTLYTVGTGREMPRDAGPSEYVGTWQDSGMVWHVFAKQPGVLAEAIRL